MNSNGYGNGYSGGIKRGDIFYADLSPVVGSEQGGLRPVLIIQNDVGNRYSPTVIAAAITSRMGHLDESIMNRVNAAIAVSFGLGGLPAPGQPSTAAASAEHPAAH